MSRIQQQSISIQDLYKVFLEMEDDLDLFSFRINNVTVWERIRSTLFLEIYQNVVSSEFQYSEKESLLSKVKFYLKSMIRVTRNPLFASNNDVIFFGSPRRIKKKDGYWWDIYTDIIKLQLDNPSMTIERDFQLEHRKPPKTRDLYYLDFLEFLIFLRGKLGLNRTVFHISTVTKLNRISKEIFNRFGIRLNVHTIVTRNLCRRKVKIPFYRKMLKKTGVKLAVIVTSYGKEDFIESAKNLEIPTIELQHGVISKFHPGYSYPGRKRTKQTFPDYLLVFGDYWKKRIDYPIEDTRIVPVGFPYLENERAIYSNSKKKNQIVIISQGRIGDLISKFAVNMHDLSHDFSITYKLHPAEVDGWEEQYPWLANSDIQVIDNDEKPLYELFAESKAQVGVFSTAIFEGLAFELNTFLIDIPGVDYMNPLIEAGLAKLVSEPREIFEFLKDMSDSSVGESLELFQDNSVSNTLDFINKMLNKDPKKSAGKPV